jgi:tRNA dimethylallyltransferase
MFEAGFVAEVERLLGEGLADGPTAGRAIGYREVAAHLAGELSLDEARERTVVATRRFARRQDSWFRKDPRIVWVDFDDPRRVDLAEAAVRRLGAGPG